MSTEERKDRENAKPEEKIEDLEQKKVSKDDAENVKGGGGMWNWMLGGNGSGG